MQRTKVFALALCACLALNIFAQSSVYNESDIEKRTDAIVSKLTLQQKIDLLGGKDAFFIREEPTAGFPLLKMADASVGVRNWGPSTAYPASIALAASWDTDLAYKLGVAVGRDSRARGVHFLLGPGVNIYRAPMNGRNFEYLGEDPWLASRLAVKWIEGVQSQEVSATVKHFAANNSEYDRHNLSSDVDERTLREIYLPAFEAAVKEAHTGAIMDSYNLINGIHATQQDWLNNQVAKKEWGFDGIIMSDWNASYDGVAEANGGLDLEMPSAKFMNEKALAPALERGKVQNATLDDKVRRIVRTAVRFGFLDRPQQDDSIPLASESSREVALQAAREGIVLLKNENNVLPLNAKSTCTLAVIGPNAWPAVTGGGGSSHVMPFEATSMMSGIADYLKAARGEGSAECPGVFYDRGLPTEDELFKATAFTNAGRDGLKQEVFANTDFNGKPLSESQVSHLALQEIPHPGVERGGKFSVRWTGEYLPKTTEKYLIVVDAGRQGAYRMLIDGKTVMERKANVDASSGWTEVDAVAGKPLHIELDAMGISGNAHGGLGIEATGSLVSERAKAIAAKAEAVVLAAGFDQNSEGEGFDRTFSLPWGQNELINEIAAHNKKTVVTLNAGGGVDMMPWLSHAQALLHLWYPGQEGGRAVAEVLFGAANPGGKLPVSLEKTWTDNPVHDSYYPSSGAGTAEPHVKYAEGVFLGYRYYAGAQVKPMFPFGFGLSYTTFDFSHLKVSPASTPSGYDVKVTFDVTNTGLAAGAEVAQLYVGDPSAHVKRPEEELKGFERIYLKPGETRHEQLTLDKRSFAYWSEQKHDWVVDAGRFSIMLGDSSAHLPLKADIELK